MWPACKCPSHVSFAFLLTRPCPFPPPGFCLFMFDVMRCHAMRCTLRWTASKGARSAGVWVTASPTVPRSTRPPARKPGRRGTCSRTPAATEGTGSALPSASTMPLTIETRCCQLLLSICSCLPLLSTASVSWGLRRLVSFGSLPSRRSSVFGAPVCRRGVTCERLFRPSLVVGRAVSRREPFSFLVLTATRFL